MLEAGLKLVADVLSIMQAGLDLAAGGLKAMGADLDPAIGPISLVGADVQWVAGQPTTMELLVGDPTLLVAVLAAEALGSTMGLAMQWAVGVEGVSNAVGQQS